VTAHASIPAMLAATVERFGERVAVVDGEVTLTWAELDERASDFGAALVEAGVEPGDRVAMWAPNGWRWIVAAHGLWRAGATLVPINTRFKGSEAAVILQRSRAKVLVTTRTFLGTDYVAMLDGAGADLPDLRTTVVAEGDTWDEFVATATEGGRAEVDRRSKALGPDDVADVLFTSGTTGVPKGVVMTHGRTLFVGTDWADMTGLTADDRYLMVNPYFHMFGLKAGILTSTSVGCAMYPEPVFDAGRVLERIAADGITALPGAPTIYQSLLDHPDRDRYDLSTLRIAVTGAADIPVELIRRIRGELPFEFVLVGYGLSEAGTATGTTPDDDPAITATTVGRARPGFEVRLVAEGVDVQPGETGEVVLRGPSVMLGYLDDPEATAAALDADGWVRTGDLGSLDDAGNLRIVGRLKDMFIVGGFNAYPAEIENALLRHPDVQQAAVIGIPDERLGEVGMAFVVTTSDDPDVAESIRAWCKDEMANYKVPRAVRVVDALPINATGKVVKDELRELAAEESS
jgi:acyl-CoA synthetase (AMP-forming)/AMP-acid ligase II